MYLRYATVRKNGNVHKHWRRVRSVRLGSKVRQQTVAQLGELDAQLLSGKWSQVREGLDVQLTPTESGAETFIVCRSLDRVTKQRAIRERFEARMEKGLSRIQAACEKRVLLGSLGGRLSIHGPPTLA